MNFDITYTYNDSNHVIIAGPCSAETPEQTMETAKMIKDLGIKIFRAGAWKPRTKPGSFEGMGEEALKWISQAKKETSLLVATEIAGPKHLELALKYNIDIFWLGARTTANPFLVQEIVEAAKGLNNCFLIKNPINPDADLWIGAIERFLNSSIYNIAAVHRGFSMYKSGYFRNNPQWQIPIEVKRVFPKLKMICDPSHIGGKRDLIETISQHSLDIGFDGLMIETHINPDSALSDSQQQITPTELKRILSTLKFKDNNEKDIESSIIKLRDEIDSIDSRVMELLSERMNISRKIGLFKKSNNIPILQPERYHQIMSRNTLLANELSMDPQFIKSIMEAIHKESIRQQLTQ